MATYDVPNFTTGVDGVLVDVVQQVPSFIGAFLFFVWALVFLGGTASQKARSGWADSPMWAVMASISTVMLTIILSLTAGLMDTLTFGIVIGVTIFSSIWLFMSRGRGEV